MRIEFTGRVKVFAILLSACLFAYLPVILAVLGGHWPFSDDSLTLFNEWREFGDRTLRSGALPLWNPHLFTGEPLLANNQSAFLYPPNLIYLIFALPWAMISDAFCHTLLLGCGGYALLRALRLSRIAALFGALCLMLGTPVAAHANNGHFSWTAARAYLPWELYALLLLLRTGQNRYAVGLGLAAAASLAAGYPPIALLGAGLCFGMLIAWPISHRAFFSRQVLSGLLFAGTLAVLLSAVYVLPLLETSHASTHGTGLTWRFATNFSANPKSYARLLMPGFFGNNDLSWSSRVPHEECGAIGVLPLLLALLAPWLARRTTDDTEDSNRLPRAVGWLWVLLPVALLMAAGRSTNFLGLPLPSFYAGVWKILPPLRSTRVPVRWLELWYLIASLLAAFSLDALLWRARRVRPATPETILRLAVGVALFICGGALLWVMLSSPQDRIWQSAGKQGSHIVAIEPSRAAGILHDYAGLQAALGALWAGAALAVLWLERSSRRAPSPTGARRLGGAFTGLLMMELLSLFWLFTKSIPPAVHAQYVWPTRLAQHYQQGTRWDTSISNNSMNEALRTGVDIWGGYDALSSTRYFKFAAQLENKDPHIFWSAVYQGIDRRPFLRVVGVDHLLQSKNFDDPGFKQLLKSKQLTLVDQDKNWALWRLTGPQWTPWPRVYLTSQVRRLPEDAQIALLDELSAQTLNPLPVVAAPDAFAQVTAQSAMPSLQNHVTNWQRTPNRFEIACQTTRPMALVVSEANWAGWHAWINGQPTRLEAANYLFRGVTVPTGKSRVTMVYEPQIFRFAAFLTLCGLTWLSAWWMAKPRRSP